MVEYPLLGFSDFTVTDSGKVFKVVHYKTKDKRIEVQPNDDVYNIVGDDGKRHRYALSRIFLAAKNGIDVTADDEVRPLMEEEFKRNSLLPIAVKVDETKDDLRKTEILAEDITTTILCELRKRDMVNESNQTAASVVAHDIILYYRMYVELHKSESLVEVELSTKGNEKRVINPLVTSIQAQSKCVKDGLRELGIDYSAIQKQVSATADKALSFFDEDVNKFEELV